ncbi:DUF2866 domain-containing protein [Paraburkholderia phymatum]|uniref:DUF2866 domain-containing protein n=1 Tax=Paraburkholderia phymatum TaxID=148447 RepID=UPI003D16B321
MFEHLRALQGNAQTPSIHRCTVSPPMHHPWGLSYRLAERSFSHDVEFSLHVVPAESTSRQIAKAVMPHVPVQRFCQPGG